MQHIYNYIIQISNELNDTFKTESGIELYGHKDFSKDRLSNRYAKIVAQPIIFEGALLDIDTEIIIDPSVYYHSIHGDDDRLQITTNTIDRDKGFYSIEPENIVIYKDGDTWRGYLDNFLGKRIVKQGKEKVTSGVITQVSKKIPTNMFEVVYVNDFLETQGIVKDDVLHMRPGYGVSVWMDGIEYYWLRNVDTLAQVFQKSNRNGFDPNFKSIPQLHSVNDI